MRLKSLLLIIFTQLFILSWLNGYAQVNDSSMILLSPADDLIIESLFPQFTWTPPGAVLSAENLSYELKVVRIWEGQGASDALANNPPWLMETGIYGNSVRFLFEAPSLVIASPYHQFKPTVRELEARLFQREALMAEYAWQVSVIDEDGNPGGIKSNINTFSILTTHQGIGYPDISFDIPSLTSLTMDLKQLYPTLHTDQYAVFDGFCIASPLHDEFKVRFLDISTYQPENIQLDAGIVQFSGTQEDPDAGKFSIEWIDNESLGILWIWDEREQSLSFPMINMSMQSVRTEGSQLGVFVFTFLDIFEHPVYQKEFMVLLGCQ